eukprot:Hpha_TRINITY_DN10319_c0_g2::TRINITY_DN10319_c0_g2_i2::g.116163::m.116163
MLRNGETGEGLFPLLLTEEEARHLCAAEKGREMSFSPPPVPAPAPPNPQPAPSTSTTGEGRKSVSFGGESLSPDCAQALRFSSSRSPAPIDRPVTRAPAGIGLPPRRPT